MIVDLHCHSDYSDGLLSPAELVALAVRHQVAMLALTDHDTVAGIAELVEAGKKAGINIVPGIELSARWRKHDIHILGLQINATHPALSAAIDKQAENRRQRAENIATSLNKLGIKDALAQAEEIAGHQHLTRPHFARVLVNNGYVKNMDAAFNQYLKRGKCAYHACEWMGVADVVHAIGAAGGIAVLAHPHRYQLTATKLHELLGDFINAGGQAIEVVSGGQSAKSTRQLAAMCQHYELYASSGSDFHGYANATVQLGKQAWLPEQLKPVWTLWASA